MSDPRLTAEQIEGFLEAMRLNLPMAGDWRDVYRGVASSHEAFRADVDRLTAEHAALKEECEQWREKAARDVGHLIDARVERDARDTLLAEASAEIARLHELLAEAGWTKEPR